MVEESNDLIDHCETFTAELTTSYTIFLLDIANIQDELVPENSLVYEEVESGDQNNSSSHIVLYIFALVILLILAILISIMR